MLKLINNDLLDNLVIEAAGKPRQRSHYNVHRSFDDPVQKLIVAATPMSYFRPHRHPDKSEFAVILRGQFDIFLFDDNGCIITRQRVGIGTDVPVFEIPANAWHCWLAVSDQAVFCETKQGPYNPDNAAEFAEWSPAEDHKSAGLYLARMKQAEPGDRLIMSEGV